ncbi:MAG TPA: hypothetical protein VN231_11595 [Allosphingosinicella sp.]|nr:hypothetical protein [Allosphingosinicella sp.]
MADDRRDLSEELPRNQEQSGRTSGGTQAGGGPGPADMAPPGGSSGSGGYGDAQNQQFHQGQQDRALAGRDSDPGLARGERFDERQGGGRGSDAVGPGDDAAEHQDRGQSIAEAESDRD